MIFFYGTETKIDLIQYAVDDSIMIATTIKTLSRATVHTKLVEQRVIDTIKG
jgi:hypothetical protein